MADSSRGNLALVIRHQEIAHLGNVLPVLERHGYDVRYIEGADIDSAPEGAALVVILGGEIGVYDTAENPFIVDELAFIARRIEAEQPTLGICLGAQLMSEAVGGRASKGKSTVIGFHRVQLTEAGRDSPLRHFDGIPVMQWHGDSFRLPTGATRLASSAEYSNEAFRLGDFALAVQFHPELTGSMYDEWIENGLDELAAEGIDADDLRAQRDEHAAAMEEASALMLDEWLGSEVVASHKR